MEDFTFNPPKLKSAIKILFYLLISVSLAIIGMLFFMQINDSVKATAGEIFSKNAPVEYTAYMEGEVKKVLVSEGDEVKKGDSLILIKNEPLLSEYTKTKENYFLEQINLGLSQKELETLHNKLAELGKQKSLIHSNDQLNQKNTSIGIQNLEARIHSLEQKLDLTEDRLEKDKSLFNEGVLSQQEFQDKRRAYLDELNELALAREQYKLKLSSRTGNKNVLSEKIQQLTYTWISLEQEIIELKKNIFQKESLVQSLGSQMNFLGKEMEKLTIIAEMDGTVATLFNEKQSTRFVPKGAPLIVIRPKEEEVFFARLQIPQSAVAKVQTGQAIHLKLEAYNYYQYGILKGTIKSIHPKDATNQFYLLAEIPNVPPHFELQSGYQVKGDIILNKMKLYRFVLEGLFGKLG